MLLLYKQCLPIPFIFFLPWMWVQYVKSESEGFRWLFCLKRVFSSFLFLLAQNVCVLTIAKSINYKGNSLYLWTEQLPCIMHFFILCQNLCSLQVLFSAFSSSFLCVDLFYANNWWWGFPHNTCTWVYEQEMDGVCVLRVKAQEHAEIADSCDWREHNIMLFTERYCTLQIILNH